GFPTKIVADGNIVVGAFNIQNGLIDITDFSNPDAPSHAAWVSLPDPTDALYVRDVIVVDHIVFAANAQAGLTVVDIHTPPTPVVRGSIASFQVPGSVEFTAVSCIRASPPAGST